MKKKKKTSLPCYSVLFGSLDILRILRSSAGRNAYVLAGNLFRFALFVCSLYSAKSILDRVIAKLTKKKKIVTYQKFVPVHKRSVRIQIVHFFISQLHSVVEIERADVVLNVISHRIPVVCN